MSSDPIKTRARYLDPDEPTRMRPEQVNHGTPLPNTIRIGLDRGRDNPFRPGGAIYKSADPIVDFYKNGGNSRPQSPTDSQLLLGGLQGLDSRAPADKATESKDHKKSCWKRYFCCCCRCSCWGRRSKKGESQEETKEKKRVESPPSEPIDKRQEASKDIDGRVKPMKISVSDYDAPKTNGDRREPNSKGKIESKERRGRCSVI